MVNKWCWCQRSECKDDELFMTLPTYLAQHGFATSGTGKIYHPDACTRMSQPDFGLKFAHRVGDDVRAWNHGKYGVEGELVTPHARPIEQNSEEQFGSIPGPIFPDFNFTTGAFYDVVDFYIFLVGRVILRVHRPRHRRERN